MNDVSNQPRIATSVIALACAVVAMATVMFYAGASWPIAAYRLLTDGAVLAVWLLAAAGWGIWCVGPLRTSSNGSLIAVSAAAIGLGLQSLLILLLGLLGILDFFSAVALIAIGLIAGAVWLWMHRPKLVPAGGAYRWLWLAAMPALGIAIVGSLFPPGILWGDEPNGYDVVEYHLQAPREWLEAGRIMPLDHNVFSYFPMGVEMHFLLAMHLRGGPWAGMYLAQMMHLAFCALAAAAVWAGLGGGMRGIIGGVVFAVTPWTILLGPVAYDDGGLLLYVPLAMAWMWQAGEASAALPPTNGAASPFGAMLLAGAMAGFAAGAKLTGIPVLWIALPIAFVLAFRRWRPIPIYLAAAAVVFSPWMIRNIVWAHNPVFPEAMSIFGRAHFAQVQEIRWQRAHLPPENQQSIAARFKALWNQVLGDQRYGYLLLPGALAAAIATWANPRVRLALLLILLTGIYWISITHLQGRFFTPALAPAAMCIALVAEKFTRAACCFAIALAIVGVAVVHPRLMHYVAMNQKLERDGGSLLGVENLTGLTPFDPATAPDQVRLHLVGDARAFLYQLPMSRLDYRTVFDVDSGSPVASIATDWLGGVIPTGKNDLTLVDLEELARFHRTYYQIPPLSYSQLQALEAISRVKIAGQ